MTERERQLSRQLWLARAERAKAEHDFWCQLAFDKKYGLVKFNIKKNWGENVKQGQTLHTPHCWAEIWNDVEFYCRYKADEFKEDK